MSARSIVSVAPASAGLFRQELGKVPGQSLVESLDEWRHLCQLSPSARLLFALHRFPVTHSATLPELDLESVANTVLRELATPPFGQGRFGIQIVANLRMDWAFSDLVELLLQRGGWDRANFSPRQPAEVLSIYLHRRQGESRLFFGVSSVSDNGSPWSSGHCRIPRDPHSISRAEAKLVEGWEAFGLARRSPGLALDLGAAPGGWSRVLSDWGYQVHAVDPAELDPKVASRVVHHRETAGRYLSRQGPDFDLLVCDMKMEASKVVPLLHAFRAKLKPGALVFTTLKLGKGAGALNEADQALNDLVDGFTLLGARQLFFNRSEISVALVNPS